MTHGLRVVTVMAALACVPLVSAATAAGQEASQDKPLTPQQQREYEAKTAAEVKRLQEEDNKRMQDQRRLTPLSVDIVVSRFQGDKRVSSLPYTLAVNANELSGGNGGGVAQLRMGATVPVPSVVFSKENPAGSGPVGYRDIGTSIDANAQRMADGSFQLRLSVEDTSVYTNIQDNTTPTVGDMPVFRKFSSTNMLVMKDGQMREFTAATDRVSGEVVRIAVTLRVVK